MTEQEIVLKYNRADNKKGQVKILAELNACDKDEIINILVKNGVNIEAPKKRGRPPKVADVKVAKKVDEEQLYKEVFKSATVKKEPKKQEQVPCIPAVVKKICQERISLLTEKIIELEKERDALCDYMQGRA